MEIQTRLFKRNFKNNLLFKLLIFLLSVLSFSSNAQYVNQLQELIGGSIDGSSIIQTNKLEELAYDIIPSVYLRNGTVKVDDELGSPIRVVTDVFSIQSLHSLHSLYADVQMIIVQINSDSELTRFLNTSSLSQFVKLKYVYISCSFELCPESSDKILCEKNKIKSIFQGELSDDTIIVYTSSKSQ